MTRRLPAPLASRLPSPLIAALIFMLLYAWGGHLFSLAVAVHPQSLSDLQQLSQSAEAADDDHGHSHGFDHSADHGQQSLHQTLNISHQHPPHTADHLHDSVQLLLSDAERFIPPVVSSATGYRHVMPRPPLFPIERPPRALS